MTERVPPEAREFPPLGEVLDTLRLIWAVDHELQRTSRQMERSLGVTAPQRLVIRIVGRFPGIPAGALAKLLHVHPGTLSGILKRLEKRGLLQRRDDPGDRRRSLLGLTDRGRTLDAEAAGTVEAAIAQVIAHTEPDKLAATREVLQSLSRALVSSSE